jgi:hypothetical protein
MNTQAFLMARQPVATSENFSKQIRVEDFFGEVGDKNRIFRMHLETKFRREQYTEEEKLDFLSSRCQDLAGTFISRFTDSLHANYEPLPYFEVLRRLDARYYGSTTTHENDRSTS